MADNQPKPNETTEEMMKRLFPPEVIKVAKKIAHEKDAPSNLPKKE